MWRSVILPVDPSAPFLARRALNEAIPPPELAARFEDARLAISELVTNAVRHAHLRERDKIRLVLEADDDHVMVEVEQPTDAIEARPVAPNVDGEPGGWGLQIVLDLADDMGVRPGPPGVVWFEFRPA